MKIAISKNYRGFYLGYIISERLLELDSNFFKWFNEDNNKHRTNKLLIKVIEEVEENQSCDIVIREIPNDIEWEIYEIEGIETIHEKHRIW